MATTTSIPKSELIAEITAAFDGVSREDGVTLHQAISKDDYGGSEEQAIARAKDTEARWQDVPHETLGERAVFSYLDAKGFHYYIPAFLVWCLTYVNHEYLSEDDEVEDEPYRWSEISALIDYHLTGGYKGIMDEYYQSRFALFTPEQSRAVARFVLFRAEESQFYTMKNAADRQSGRLSSEADQIAIWEKARQLVAEEDLPENECKRAIDQYWGQFL